METRKTKQLVYNKNTLAWRLYPEKEKQTNAKEIYYCYSSGNLLGTVRSGYMNCW